MTFKKSTKGRKAKKKISVKPKLARAKQNLLHNTPLFNLPRNFDDEPLEGFRKVGFAKAMVLFAQPVIDLFRKQGQDDSIALEIAQRSWNCALDTISTDLKLKEKFEAIRLIRKGLGYTPEQANELLHQLIERKRYLFPLNLPLGSPPMIYMRKEHAILIPEFNYNDLSLKKDVIPADEKDREMVELLRELDDFMESYADYDDYEPLLSKTHDLVADQFHKWLVEKSTQPKYFHFPYRIAKFLDFIYAYGHGDVVTLKSISENDFLEFFLDYLMRKETCPPQEYVFWPPAIRCFYQFLKEKKYLFELDLVTNILEIVEPLFIEFLRKEYS